jgi:signal transduction histidine kinase
MAALGGEVRLESPREGGSRFVLRFPLAAALRVHVENPSERASFTC